MSYKNDPYLVACVKKHNEEREMATREHIESGEWRKQFEWFCTEVFQLALDKRTTEELYAFSKKHKNIEELIFNFFTK